jgi:hypothetical protein
MSRTAIGCSWRRVPPCTKTPRTATYPYANMNLHPPSTLLAHHLATVLHSQIGLSAEWKARVSGGAGNLATARLPPVSGGTGNLSPELFGLPPSPQKTSGQPPGSPCSWTEGKVWLTGLTCVETEELRRKCHRSLTLGLSQVV